MRNGLTPALAPFLFPAGYAVPLSLNPVSASLPVPIALELKNFAAWSKLVGPCAMHVVSPL